MALLDRAVRFATHLGLVSPTPPPPPPPPRLHENWTPVREAFLRLTEGSSTADDSQWRRLGSVDRDLSSESFSKMHGLVSKAMTSNAISSRAIAIRAAIVLGEGFTIDADSPAVKAYLQEHWELNEWDSRGNDRMIDLLSQGELNRWRPDGLPNVHDGHWEASPIFPTEIDSVVLDPSNRERPVSVNLASELKIASAVTGQIRTVTSIPIMRKAKFGNPATGLVRGDLTGELIRLTVNQRLGSTRGLSDLLSVGDWLDAYDEILANEIERVRHHNAYLYDVTLKRLSDRHPPASAEDINEFLRSQAALGPPKNGSIRAHGDDVEWNLLQPDARLSTAETLLNMLFKIIWGGLGLPEHLFFSGDGATAIRAGEMMAPVWAWARILRKRWESMLMLELSMALQDGRKAIPSLASEPQTFWLEGRDPDRTAYSEVATTLDLIGRALGTAMTMGFLDQSEASRLFRLVAGSFGLEIEDLTDTAPKITAASSNGAPRTVEEYVEVYRSLLRAQERAAAVGHSC